MGHSGRIHGSSVLLAGFYSHELSIGFLQETKVTKLKKNKKHDKDSILVLCDYYNTPGLLN